MSASSFTLRKHPKVIPDRLHCPPTYPQALYATFYHPGRDLSFLSLPAYDHRPGPVIVRFGVHHETAVTACRILAYNRLGFLSTSRDREDQAARVTEDPDFVLLPQRYYYHLCEPLRGQYPICHDFRQWSFPHNALPPSWATRRTFSEEWVDINTWSELSVMVEGRDKGCLVTRSQEALVTARLLPANEETWVSDNRLLDLDFTGWLVGEDTRNLFTLRADLYTPQFEQGNFVIVPKGGQLMIHFLREGEEYPQYYHNVPFDHGGKLLHSLLYARFAWALIKITKDFLDEDFCEKD